MLARTLQAPRYNGAIGLSSMFRQYASTGEEATPGVISSSAGLFVYHEILLGGVVDDTASEARRPHLQ